MTPARTSGTQAAFHVALSVIRVSLSWVLVEGHGELCEFQAASPRVRHFLPRYWSQAMAATMATPITISWV